MFNGLNYLLNLILGGPESTSFAIALRLGVIACTILALVQLTMLWGTRWGDRNSISKSLFLSLFVHLCLALGWASLHGSSHVTTIMPTAEVRAKPSEIPIQLVMDNMPGNDVPGSGGPGTSDWQNSMPGTGHNGARERPNRQMARLEETLSVPAPEKVFTPKDIIGPGGTEAEGVAPPKTVPPSPLKAQKVSASTKVQDTEQDVARDPNQTTNQQARSRRPIQRPQNAATETREVSVAMTSQASSRRPRELIALPPQTPENTLASTQSSPTFDQRTPRLQPTGPASSANVIEQDPRRIPKMTLVGSVRDAQTARPLSAAKIHVDRLQGSPSTATTSRNGDYQMNLSDVPEYLAVTVTLDGYLPESRSVRSTNSQFKISDLDFTLQPINRHTIALEDNPSVRHLGNDRFEGRINSQFQRPSEGTTASVRFKISADQLRSASARATVVFLAKGMQCSPDVRVNGQLLGKLVELSPADGAFGTVTLPFDSTILRPGDNVLTVQAVVCNGDLDDFEFVNPQIKLSPSE